jgi:hypothetical protein
MKDKFLLAGISELILVFGLMLNGCSQPDDPVSNPVDGRSAVAVLTGITIGGQQATLGTPSAEWNQVGEGVASLSAANATNAEVAVTKPDVIQTHKFAKVTGTGEPQFDTGNTFTFADGDFLYIEVTAEDETTKRIYKVEVQIGRDVSLSEFKIGGIDVTDIGTPSSNLARIKEGRVLVTASQPNGGYAITISNSTGADVTWIGVNGSDQPTDFATNAYISFTDGQYLYVKVISENGSVTAYYKILVNLMLTATVGYGKPEITNGTIASAWNDVTEEYDIARVGKESTNSFKTKPDTSGKTKFLFDEDGIYVYVDVTDPSVNTTGSLDYLKDSVELFINEAVDASGNVLKIPPEYDTKGGHYRVSASGAVSGDPAAAADALTSANVSAWVKASGDGYVVIFKAPWRFKNSYPLENGKKFGLELQINACSDGDRDGVVVWNNYASPNYQDVTCYGEAVLNSGSHTLPVSAKMPNITAQPVSRNYWPDATSTYTATPLSATAVSTDSGTLTYQWYSNSADTYTGGSLIDGATTSTYTPPVSAEGTTYYWVEVTNTIAENNDGGLKAATRQSSIAKVIVDNDLVEKIVAGGSSTPTYRFSPEGTGTTWSDYKTITYTIMVADQQSYNLDTGRGYVLGHIPENQFSNNANTPGGFSYRGPGAYGNTNWGNLRLMNFGDAKRIAELIGEPGLYEWGVLSYPIVRADIPDSIKVSGYPASPAVYPADNATGPFYFSLGLTVNPNSAPAGTRVTYYIKDIALVKEDGTKLYADDLRISARNTTLGQFRFLGNQSEGQVIRSLEPVPEKPAED